MSSKQSTVDFILDQISGVGKVSAKKMFGEFGIYSGEKILALVCDDQLFVKKTAKGKTFLGEWDEGFPYPGAKPCFLISGEKWEEREWLSELIKITAADLSEVKKKSTIRTSPKKAR
jgi:TfoX/Sxy family transcriptional regulator of competence genes